MDSGCVVPTLSPGLRETVAAKLLTVAVLRRAGLAGARLGASPRGAIGAAALSNFMLLRRAFFLAAERAGRSIAVRTAMRATTMSNSMSVKARRAGNFIHHLMGFHDRTILSIADATAFFGQKRPIPKARGQKSA